MIKPVTMGCVVWVEMADANGIRKERPAIVVTPSPHIQAGGTLEVVAITSRVPAPLPDDHVLLPWHPAGHPRTRLNRKCAAVCSWVAIIHDSEVRDVGGLIPSYIMRVILEKAAAFLTPPTTPLAGSTSPTTSGTSSP